MGVRKLRYGRTWLALCVLIALLQPVSAYADVVPPDPGGQASSVSPISFQEIYRTDGHILDYDGEKALVYRSQDQTVSIAGTDGGGSEIIARDVASVPDKAQLTAEGALFHLPGAVKESMEYRNGMLQTLQAYSWVSNGLYLAYYDSSGTDGSLDEPGTNGLRLRYGDQVESIVNPRNHYYPLGGYDVTDDGTVVYSFVGQLYRYRGGQIETLTPPPAETNPNGDDPSEVMADGASILFTSYYPQNAVKLMTGGKIATLSGPYEDIVGDYYQALKHTGVAIAEGWTAFPRFGASASEATLWLRSPDGADSQLGLEPGVFSIKALSPTGQLVYAQQIDGATHYFVNLPDAETGLRENVEAPSGNAKWIAGNWSFWTDTAVYRMTRDDAGPNSLTIEPQNLDLLVGDERQLTVKASFTGVPSEDVTAKSSYTSSDPSFASVSAGGSVTAQSAGTAVVTAAYAGKQVSVPVRVNVKPPVTHVPKVVLLMDKWILSVGESRQLMACAYFSDDSWKDVTTGSAYSSADPSVATVSAQGKIQAVSPGMAVISATYSGATNTVMMIIVE